MTRVYYKEAKAGLIVFDGSNRSTFETVERWKTDLDNKVSLDDGSPLPVLLLANKSDLAPDVADEELRAYTAEHGFLDWLRVSAKEDKNVDNGMKQLISYLMKMCPNPEDADDDDAVLDIRSRRQPPDDNSCC